MSNDRFPWWLVFLGVGLALAAGGVAYVSATARKSGPRWLRLLPETRAKVQELESRALAAGLPVMFFDGWRGPDEEARNKAAGTSRLANPLDSMHVWGAAFDFAFRNRLGLPEWPPAPDETNGDPRWRQLAQIAQSIGLRSGGLMWGWDWGHFQLPGISTAALRASYADNYFAFLSSRGVAVA